MSLIHGSVLVICAAISWNILSLMFKPKLPPIVEGHFHPKFRRVAELFRSSIESGKERGAAFALYYKGELLIDLWGGYADEESEQPWDNKTITLVCSVTKGIAAITAAKMVEKGWLDYSKPVSYYWPEFSENGKDNITVDMLLSHQAGLLKPGGETYPSLLDIQFNGDEIEKLAAKATPSWPPGTRLGYHMLSFGFFIDTLLKKADPKHRSISQIFRQEIAEEYGIDFYIGVPPEENYRVARTTFMSYPQLFLSIILSFDFDYYSFYFNALLRKHSYSAIAFQSPKELSVPARQNNPTVRATTFSSSNGFTSAKALAKLYGILAAGGSYQGRQLLSKDSIDKLKTVIADGFDEVLQRNRTSGRGVMLHPNSQGITTFGHSGFGGQASYADPENELGLSYVTNFASFYFVNDDPRFKDLEKATYACFQQYVESQKT